MLRQAVIALLIVSCLAPALAFTRDEVLLYVPFDGSLEPAVAAEGTEPTVVGEFGFDAGIIGEAVRVGGEGTNLTYPTAGNMWPEEGTFAIWVQSVDWTLTDAPLVNRWWIDVGGPTRFLIYHYLHTSGISFYHMDVRGEHPSMTTVATTWAPGEWKHLVGTWRQGRLRLYINGERAPEELQVELGPIGPAIRIGGPVNSSEPVEARADTNLDEFYVFARALEDVEVRALYQRGVAEHAAVLVVPPIPAPALDGVIADGEWASAAGVTGFVNRVTGLLDAEQGNVWIGHDDTNLYVAQRWPIPERVLQQPDNYSFGAFRREATQRDGELLAADDTVGVQVQGADGLARTLIANAAGTIGDMAGDDLAWDSGATAACTVDGGAWVCELTIPLAQLGLAPGDAAQMRLVRTHRLLRDDEVAWPTPDAYASAALGTQPGAVRLTSIGSPGNGRLDVRLGAAGGGLNAIVVTDSGEVEVARRLGAGEELAVEHSLTDNSVTLLNVQATRGDETLLAVAMPFTYPPMLEVAHFLYPSLEQLEVVISTRGAASAAPAAVAVSPAAGGEATASASVEGGQGDVRTVPVSIANLQPGEYLATVTVGAGERLLGQERFGFEVLPRPEWLGNTIGIIDYVPDPWTPLHFDGDTVSCWGREIDLSGLLPVQMTSQGEELLAAPLALVASIAGVEQRPGAAQVEWVRQDDQRGERQARAALGPVQARTSSWIEYDGCMWFELTLSAEQPVTVDALRLEVPMARQCSTLLYSGNYRGIGTGATPATPWASSFVNCLGLSNERVGLQWFAQSRRGWNLSRLDRAIEVVPGADANTLVINFIDTPTEIGPAPRTVWFGLHPTPIKPPLPGRRMIRPVGKVEGEPGPNLALWCTNWCLGCSYALPINEPSRQWNENRRAEGIRTHVYTRLAECSVKGPWYGYFRDEWRVDPGPRMEHSPDEEDWGKANPVCQNSRSWQDWTLWSFAQAIPAVGADGWYYDVSRPALCRNHHHGCGYLNERGEWEPETQILAARELHRRMWILAHEQLGVQISHHMSGHLWTPTQSFSDMIIDGENLTSMLKDNYCELLPLDTFRAEYMGHQWGLTSIFLPEFSRAQLTPEGKELYESPEKLPEVRHLAGMIFLHDSLPWPAYSDLTPYQTIWAAQDALGWGDQVEFLPYWDNAQYLQPMGAELVASIFRNGNRALVVLFNNTDDRQDARLQFDLQALGVDATSLTDFETNERFALEGGTATVPILQRNFRLLMMQP
ncbi:MAG: glycoside hydrolase domain-containing protein [Armatimonadota bacterium]